MDNDKKHHIKPNGEVEGKNGGKSSNVKTVSNFMIMRFMTFDIIELWELCMMAAAAEKKIEYWKKKAKPANFLLLFLHGIHESVVFFVCVVLFYLLVCGTERLGLH